MTAKHGADHREQEDKRGKFCNLPLILSQQTLTLVCYWMVELNLLRHILLFSHKLLQKRKNLKTFSTGQLQCNWHNSQRDKLINSLHMNRHKRATPKWVTKSCDNRYDEVCGWNSIKDVASCLVFNPFGENFDLDFWPWTMVKVISTWVIECALLGCTLVPSMKSVGEIAYEIGPVL